ncbi:hypothetical protein OPV22_005481 [Ensete ventricosum]|uniref:C3H1-type domain-containing protein n=1 Tax=Ensete ventricosum TaxID=4639 RepID=A0AAV8RCW9_ENSVE|nr:hypothetical protein OPV22_005481 [Ensete ventricosum]
MPAMEMTAPPPSEENEVATRESTVAVVSAGNDALEVGHGVDSSSAKRKREEEEEEKEVEGVEETKVSDAGDGKTRRDLLWKTSLCSFYRRQPGKVGCSHGDACRYAHGEAELRIRPDNTWDPTSERAKKLLRASNNVDDAKAESLEAEDPTVDVTSLDKCLIGLPRKWASNNLKSFLDGQGLLYKTIKKKKGMTVGFVCFEDNQQLKRALEVLNENSTSGKQIKVADAIRRSHEKKSEMQTSNQTKGQLVDSEQCTDDPNTSTSTSLIEDDDAVEKDTSVFEGLVSKTTRTARDVVTPLADLPYGDQLEKKKNTLMQTLKRLTRNARKACPASVALPEWITKSREIGGLPCKFEGILESPLTNGYRNKCEFSVGVSLKGKPTVGFMVGNFREGITAIEEPINCPNVSRISSEYALIFQEFLSSSVFPIWNRLENKGFWRQFTVREGRKTSQTSTENAENSVVEVMLIIQVCSSDIDAEIMKNEFQKMAQSLAHRAAACQPPLPLTVIVVQDHKGISNAAPADCPLIPLMVPVAEQQLCLENKYASEARIHDYISNLRFSISPTAFFQVNTLAAERLYSLAGNWADLNPETLLFDICCGTGTIGLTLAHRVGMVVGIEMNASAVSDAQRNAMINDIKNCRFVCGKAEDVVGALLKEYLDVPKQHGIISDVLSMSHTAEASEEEMLSCPENGPNKNLEPEGVSVENYDGEVKSEASLEGCCSEENLTSDSMAVDGPDKDFNVSLETMGTCSAECSETTEDNQVCKEPTEEKCASKDEDGAGMHQFKNVVAIVDPPRVGLHPVVIKALRTHPRIRRLVYISCNPESLVANAIELCTPTTDMPEKGKGNRGWRNMSSAGLARYRAKSMPKSEPFQPVRAMAVDMFPHTDHCEMVMLLER